MWQSEATVDIAAPVGEVYAYLADFKRHPEWSRGVKELEQSTEGAVGVGTEFRAVEAVPMKFVSFARITRLEEPAVIAWEAWDEAGMMKTQWSFELASSGEGTRLTQRCSWEPQKLVIRVMFNLIRKRQIPGENWDSLSRIKARVEGGSAGRATRSQPLPAEGGGEESDPSGPD